MTLLDNASIHRAGAIRMAKMDDALAPLLFSADGNTRVWQGYKAIGEPVLRLGRCTISVAACTRYKMRALLAGGTDSLGSEYL